MRPIKLMGAIPVDPYSDDLFQRVIERRKANEKNKALKHALTGATIPFRTARIASVTVLLRHALLALPRRRKAVVLTLAGARPRVARGRCRTCQRARGGAL